MEPVLAMAHTGNAGYLSAYLNDTGLNINCTSENGETALFSAIRRNDEQAVRTLIKTGADVNHKDAYGNTALLVAARLGTVNILHCLREANCSLDESNRFGETALMLACCGGHAMFAQTLIDFGASVNKADLYGMTAVMLASQKDEFLDCLNLLLAAGADADATSTEGLTPLMLASRDGALRCIKHLILHGVNKNAVDKNGISALMLAAREGHSNCLRTLILAGCDPNIKDKYGDTAILTAATYNRVECVKLLNSRCADVNVQNSMGMTALMVAALQTSRQGVLQQLLLSGARTDVKNAKGHTALMIATMSGNFHAVKFLINSNADISIHDNDGNNALMLAAREDKVQILGFLIEKGINLEHCNERDETALMVAAEHGTILCLDLLLKNHANINHQSKKTGMTALMMAAVNDQASSLNLLIQAGAMLELQNQKSETALMMSIEKGISNSFHILLQARASTHATNQDGQTPLMLAATKLDTLYMWKLLQSISASDHFSGVYINTKDTHGNTALMIAAERGLGANVEILLQHGAEVNMVNNKGESPLVLASLAGHECCVKILALNRAGFMNDDNGQKALLKAIVLGQRNIVEGLIYAGANVNLPDKLARMPLLCAVGVKQVGCVEVLLNLRAYVDQTDQDGNTSLMKAAAFHSVDSSDLRQSLDINNSDVFNDSDQEIRNKTIQCLQLLISAGADLNRGNNKGRTAIMLAAMSKRDVPSHIRLLLQHGGNANLQDNDGFTALMHAVDNLQDDECVLALLRATANINAQNTKGQNALMLAKSYKHLEHLLAASADVNLIDNSGQTALMIVAGKVRLRFWPIQGYKDLFSSLTGPFASVDAQDSQGETALMKASSAGNEDHVQALLQIGANVHLNDLKGRTALMHLVISETLDDDHVFETDGDRSAIARLLVDHGSDSDVNMLDENGMSALMMMSSVGLEETIQVLLHCGANVNLTDHTGKTALMHVTDRKNLREEFEHASIARKFVNRGSDVNQKDDNGMTALMMASSRGMRKTVRALLDCGADVNLQDNIGKTALMHIAVRDETSEEDSDDDYWVDEDDFVSVVDQLVEHGTDVNMRDDNGMTALMHVAKCKRSDFAFLISLLTRHHANTDLCDNEGKTALAHACENCNSIDDCRTVLSLARNDAFPKIEGTNTSLLTSSLSRYLSFFMDEGYGEAIALTRFFVSNGVMSITKAIRFWELFGRNDSGRWSPLLQTIQQSYGYFDADLHIAKYLIANCYISTTDMDRIRSDDLPDSLDDNVEQFLKKAFANPWPLVKLAQIAVSTAIGPSPRREERIRQTGLPQPIMDCLMFDRPIALLHNNWELIPMCFEPRQYALQPSPYPLLYNWPFGHRVVPCDCNVCEQKDENFRFTRIIRS